MAVFVNLGVYRRWALLVVSGPTHRIHVVVVHSSLLGGIRQWLSLGRIRWCWAGFAGVGLRWGGSSSLGWICPRWSFVIRWDSSALVAVGVDSPVLVIVGLDLPALVLPTLVLHGLILHHWVGFVAVGRRWGDSSPLGWNCWCWSSLGWIHPLWSSWFPTPSPPCVPLLHRTVSPSLPGSFLPLSLSSFFPSPDRGWITKTDHDKRCGSCFVTHSWGLPLHGSPASSSLPGSSIERDLAAHIPLKRGGTARAASSLVREPKRC